MIGPFDSYDQWVSRKNQWDKDFEIKDGGPSKEVRDGLLQYKTFLECNEGKIRPIARQPGHWLRYVFAVLFSFP